MDEPAGTTMDVARTSSTDRTNSGGKWQVAKAMVTNSLRMSAAFTTLRDMYGEETLVDPTHLKPIKVLGEGAFGTVEKCLLQNDKEKLVVAVKKLKPEILNDPAELEFFREEIALLKKLKHKNIVEFIGVGSFDTSSDSRSKETTFLVQEFMDGGTLKSLVTKQMLTSTHMWKDADALRWLGNVAEGLAYLHSASPMVIHRDLKLENILLTGGPVTTCTAKLADFGLSTKVKRKQRLYVPPPPRDTSVQTDSQKELQTVWSERASQRKADPSAHLSYDLSGQTGSLMYMAPEVFSHKPYNEKADVFSFAMLMYETLTRYFMLAAVSHKGTREELEAYAAQVAAGYRPPLSERNVKLEGARQLLEQCWAQEPSRRPSMAQVANRLYELAEEATAPARKGAKGGGAKTPAGEPAPKGGCCTIS